MRKNFPSLGRENFGVCSPISVVEPYSANWESDECWRVYRMIPRNEIPMMNPVYIIDTTSG